MNDNAAIIDTFKTKPFAHQLTGLNLMKGRPHFANLCEMGTGKSWMHVNEIAQLWGEGKLQGVLIFAPKGVHSNWIVSEIPKHMPDWVFHISREWNADSRKDQERWCDDILRPAPATTTASHGGRLPLRVLAMNWESLQAQRGLDYAVNFAHMFSGSLMVICDEAQRIKNPSAVRTKALQRKIRRHSIPAGYRRISSGSIVLQGPFDLYAPFSFLDENILQTTSYFAFKTEYAELLQPGNKLLDHIVKAKVKMSGSDRQSLLQNMSSLSAMLHKNGRGDLIETFSLAESAMEGQEWEQLARHLQSLRESFNPAANNARKSIALDTVRHIESVIGAHHTRVQQASSNPHRLPQIVAKNKEGQPKYKNLERLRGLIEPHSYRVLKKDCLDLPQKIYTQTWFKMTAAQERAYDKMKEECRMVLTDGTIAPVNKLGSLMKLSQICSGFLIEPITKNIIKLMEDEDNPKLQLLDARLEDNVDVERKSIVWARFTEEIEQIKRLCGKHGWSYCVYDGRTNKDARTLARQQFQEGELDVFIGQQQAGGTGITLTRSSRVFYYSNSFALEDRVQSEDRPHRIGQTEDVVYEDLLCDGTVDVKITAALRAKQEIAAIITGDVDALLDAPVVL